MLVPSWDGVQVVQVLFPRQAVLTLSPGIVQAMHAFIPRQAVLIPLGQEEVQAVQAKNPSQAGWSLIPIQGASGTTAEDTISSPDNVAGITREQGQRPRGQQPQHPQMGQAQSCLLGVLPPDLKKTL